MRPRKEDIPIKEWKKEQLEEILKDKKASEATKKKIHRILEERREKGFEFLQRFFNPRFNKFWLLAQWQLYREGKARVYTNGKHLKFYIDDKTLIFDKMIEIKAKFDKFQTGKDTDDIKRELQAWKR